MFILERFGLANKSDLPSDGERGGVGRTDGGVDGTPERSRGGKRSSGRLGCIAVPTVVSAYDVTEF